MIKTNHDHFKFLLRYLIAGGIVTLIDITLFMYLVNFFSNLTTAFTINYFVGVIVSFIFHGKITFMQKNYKFSKLPFFLFFIFLVTWLVYQLLSCITIFLTLFLLVRLFKFLYVHSLIFIFIANMFFLMERSYKYK